MNKFTALLLGVVLGAIACVGLVACTTTGSVATSKATVDWGVTLQRTCTGLKGLDAVYTGLVKGYPTILSDDQKTIATAAEGLLNTVCTSPAPTDIPGAVAAVAVASVDLGNLVAALSR